jgi:hypothetical protein
MATIPAPCRSQLPSNFLGPAEGVSHSHRYAIDPVSEDRALGLPLGYDGFFQCLYSSAWQDA